MQKKQVFYIHGGSSYSNYDDYVEDLRNQPLRSASDEPVVEKWPSTLRSALGGDYQVFMPSFPNSNNAKYKEWKIWFEKHFEYLHDDIVMVGWSQGGYFLAKYLSENTVPFQIKALFLLAAPIMPDDFGGEDGGDFQFDSALLPNLAKQSKNITIMHSTDDFVVPYEHALKYKAALPEAELVTFTDKNHFLVEELPELVERIKQLT